jgi:mannosyltransferase OCH1-like enzyme
MIVNGFWYGNKLDELSLFCINSWVKHGYEFHLWSYTEYKIPGVIFKNAEDLLPSESYFTYDKGHSAGTPVAFSNYFRAVLLYEIGGLYVDLDMLCVKPYRFVQDYVFCEQEHSAFSLSIGTSIIYVKERNQPIFKDWCESILEKRKESIRHGDLGPDLFTSLVKKYSLHNYTLSKEYFNPVDWENSEEMFIRPFTTYGIHLFSSQWTEKDFSRLATLKQYYGE